MSNKVETTDMQKRAADNIIQQKMTRGRVNKKKALLDAGYSESVAKKPTDVTKSVGFLQYMDENGLTDENLAAYLAEDIKAKKGERLGELKLAFEVKGITKNTLDVNLQNADETLSIMKELIDGEQEQET